MYGMIQQSDVHSPKSIPSLTDRLERAPQTTEWGEMTTPDQPSASMPGKNVRQVHVRLVERAAGVARIVACSAPRMLTRHETLSF